MRQIVITQSIREIADSYKSKVHAHEHYGDRNLLINPLRKLTTLKKAFENNAVLEYDAASDSFHPLADNERFVQYLELVIQQYNDDLLVLMPAEYENRISEYESILPQNRMTTVLRVRHQTPQMFHVLLCTALMYTDIRTWILPRYIRATGVKCCVYCNANYAITDDSGHAYYTVDHWKPKSRYPYLCTSFYNLVPCCFTCNNNKNDDDRELFGLYVDREATGDDLFRFVIDDTDYATYLLTHDKDCLNIRFNAASGKYADLQANMDDVFHIEAIYQEHKDVAEEVLWKRKIYNTSNIDSLNDAFADLHMSQSEVARFILGTYPSPDELHRRPLTKLMQDIFRQK